MYAESDMKLLFDVFFLHSGIRKLFYMQNLSRAIITPSYTLQSKS